MAARLEDFSKRQRSQNSRQCFTAHNQYPNAQYKTHQDMTKTSSTNLSTTQSLVFMHSKNDKPQRRLISTTYKVGKKYDERERLNWSFPFLQSCSNQPISYLRSQITYLEQENAAILKKIIEMEAENMKSASQQLHQYNRAENNVVAMQDWTDRQKQNAQHDLSSNRAQRENLIKDLRIQLQSCEEKIRVAQENLNSLRDYRDREHSVKTLEAAELERQLRVLDETHQDQAADVTALANTEIQKMLDSQQRVKDATLQNVVEEQLKSAPLSVERLCFENQKLRQEIHAYRQMIAEIQNEVLVLLKRGDCLSKLWSKETDRFCRDLLLCRPICTPDEDVDLNIPFNKQMHI